VLFARSGRSWGLPVLEAGGAGSAVGGADSGAAEDVASSIVSAVAGGIDLAVQNGPDLVASAAAGVEVVPAFLRDEKASVGESGVVAEPALQVLQKDMSRERIAAVVWGDRPQPEQAGGAPFGVADMRQAPAPVNRPGDHVKVVLGEVVQRTFDLDPGP